jgi:uncharacterized protein (TIGR00369 family)
MEPKVVKESVTFMSMMMLPDDANPVGNVHGGVILKQVDTCGGVVAARHARANVVTASIDRVDFHNPCYVGNLLVLQGSLNHVGRSSMEVGVRVEAENVITGERKHIASAYLTLVALDGNRRPMPVPRLVLETEDEKRRYHEAEIRREHRLQERGKPDGG